MASSILRFQRASPLSVTEVAAVDAVSIKASANKPNFIALSALGALLLGPLLSAPSVAAEQTVYRTVTPSTSLSAEVYFNQGELDAMLAPIALYPDTVLSHVLIASTYPLEIVKAHRFVEANSHLKGDKALIAVERFDWDPSVKALVAFPELLARLSEDLDWTQRVGDAFLSQESDVTTSIQSLRSRAYDSGHLTQQPQVKVVREEKVIVIEPVQTQLVYIPYYDPWTVYGTWHWRSYSPFSFRRPVGFSVSVGHGFHWGLGIQLSPNFYFSAFRWPERRVVVIDPHRHKRAPHFYAGHQISKHKDAHHWKHNPQHRRGVTYPPQYRPQNDFKAPGPERHFASTRARQEKPEQPRPLEQKFRHQEEQRHWAKQVREERGAASRPEREGPKGERPASREHESKLAEQKKERFLQKEREFKEPPQRRVDQESIIRRDIRQNEQRFDPATDVEKPHRPPTVQQARADVSQTERPERAQGERAREQRVETSRTREFERPTPRAEMPREPRSDLRQERRSEPRQEQRQESRSDHRAEQRERANGPSRELSRDTHRSEPRQESLR